MHLGRPIHAYRAIKMWKRSWLSREILMFACFSGTGAAYAGSLWFHLRISPVLGLSTALLGTAGIAASAFIYLVKARPAWNSKHTVADFFLTGALLGSLFAASIGVTAALAGSCICRCRGSPDAESGGEISSANGLGEL